MAANLTANCLKKCLKSSWDIYYYKTPSKIGNIFCTLSVMLCQAVTCHWSPVGRICQNRSSINSPRHRNFILLLFVSHPETLILVYSSELVVVEIRLLCMSICSIKLHILYQYRQNSNFTIVKCLILPNLHTNVWRFEVTTMYFWKWSHTLAKANSFYFSQWLHFHSGGAELDNAHVALTTFVKWKANHVAT